MPDEIKKTNVETSPQGQAPVGTKETTPTRTYTQKEYDDAVAAKGAEWGRKNKTLEIQLKSVQSQLSTIAAEKAGLEASIKTIEEVGGDAAKLTQKLREVTARELTLNEREKIVQEADLATNATMIASEYIQNDPERLLKACKKAGVKSNDEAGIREMVEILGWTPIVATEVSETKHGTLVLDSGKTAGGSSGTYTREQIKNMTPEEYAKNQTLIWKALAEGKVK